MSDFNSTTQLNNRVAANTIEFLERLNRGGAFAYYWTITGDRKTSHWYEVGQVPEMPAGDAVYFGVHPTRAIPTHNKAGEPSPQKYVRSQTNYVAGVNCLFSEFDAKHYGGSKRKTLAHVESLSPPPTVVNDSGGGYHAYWILNGFHPFADLDEMDRVRRLQYRWVDYTGGDEGAKDLARVLRVPGSINNKYSPPRPVTIVADSGPSYDLGELAAYLPPEPERKAEPVKIERGSLGDDEKLAAAALEDLHPWRCDDYGEWVRVGMALRSLGDTGLALWESWSRGSDKYKPGECAAKWKTFSPSGVKLGSLFWMADEDTPSGAKHANGGKRGAESNGRVASDPPPNFEFGETLPEPPAGGDSAQPDSEKFHLTDLGNARRFAHENAGKVLYTAAWDWMAWTGKRWERDETGQVRRLAHKTISRLYDEARAELDKAESRFKTLQEKALAGDSAALRDETENALAKLTEAMGIVKKTLAWALQSQNTSRIEGMLKEARVMDGIAARVDEFDCDPWILNVQNGILDLRTGELRPHDPAAKLTRLAGTHYNPDAKCPTWLNFLQEIFEDKQDVIDFVRRAVGYSLTGDVSEQCLFFAWGSGANGKSTFSGAVQEMLGTYAMKTRAETLMVKRQDAIPEEVAQLKGVRFMLASELGEGQRLNESLVKDLTGGDKIRARLLHQNSFEFAPVAKPWLYGNHKPTIRGTDEGIWRRPRLIPFNVFIPEANRDSRLSEKLRAELPGILAWAVTGCLEWQKDGLQTPADVSAATAEFRREQDVIAAFVDECCILHRDATVTSGELYSTYARWCEKSGLRGMSKIAFSRQMDERGYSTKNADGSPRRDGNGRAYYLGLGILADVKDYQN